jgi:hypothetical protein
MGRKKKAAVSLPGDVSGEPDIHGEVNMYNKAITDKMMVALAEELIKYENKERIKLLCVPTVVARSLVARCHGSVVTAA